MGEKRKFDPTIPAVIGVLILVVVLANVMPSCSSDKAVDVAASDMPGATGAAGTTQAAQKSPPIWLTADGDPYAGPLLRTVDAPLINRHTIGGNEVAMGTDGKAVVLQVTLFDDRMDYVRDASSTDLWLNESLDVWIAGSAADARLYRYTVDVTGRTSMQSYEQMTGKRDTVGTPVTTTTATARVTTAFYGWEARIRIPLDDVGAAALAADSSVRLQVHRNQGGLNGEVTALIRAGKAGIAPPDLTFANLVPVWARKPTPVVATPIVDAAKTAPAFIAFVDDIQQDGPISMPTLRQADGQPFTAATTDFRVSTDGKTLRLDAFCFDPNPAEMVTSHSDPGDFTPFRDDSLELFFMGAEPGAEWYYQICISNTGEYQIYRCKNVPENMILRPYEPSADFSVVVRKHGKGFDVQMWIPVAELGVSDGLKAGDELRLQLVRNWRGQHVEGSSLLQLFPAAIYSHPTDLSNHHRAGFVPCRVIVPDAVEN